MRTGSPVWVALFVRLPQEGTAMPARPERPSRDSRRTSARQTSARRSSPQRELVSRTAEQQAYDGPDLPDDVTGAELDREVRRQLSSLPDKLADRVARHLVMAGRLIPDDPETAYHHAKAARLRAGRVAVIREACGETAYYSGRFAEAISEFRAARRMNGSVDYLPMVADSERALGRPERALALARDAAVSRLSEAGQVEMTIVAAGARRDRNEVSAALALLEAAPLHSRSRAGWVARLRYAYADTLVEAKRLDDATEWFHRTIAADAEYATDAAERLTELAGDSTA